MYMICAEIAKAPTLCRVLRCLQTATMSAVLRRAMRIGIRVLKINNRDYFNEAKAQCTLVLYYYV